MTVHQRLTGTTYPLKLSSNEFLALAEAGIFRDYARTELIEGEVWTMNAVHLWHARTHTELIFQLRTSLAAFGRMYEVFTAGSVRVSDDSVPEPDISVAVTSDATSGVIALTSVNIAIEISDSTRDMDLLRKPQLYARHGIPEYWVVDRDTRTIEVMWVPRELGYDCSMTFAFGEIVQSQTIIGLQAATDMLTA